MHGVQLRNYLVGNTNWAQSRTQVLHVTSQGIAIMKGSVVTILTNIGSPVRFESKEWICSSLTVYDSQPQNTSMFAYTPWPHSFSSNE
jgi:alpha-amylase